MDIIGISAQVEDRKGLLRDLSTIIAARGANIEYIQSVSEGGQAQMYFELSNASNVPDLTVEMEGVDGVLTVETYRPFDQIYGKRVIVIGGGAQVSQVVQGAVNEADRHNIRGERISVDTIPLIGEEKLAEAVRAVGRLPRVGILVLAGSIMGGEVALAVKEIKEKYSVPVVSLNMAGSVPDVVDLVVTDPVQAGVMAVMAVSENAKFDIEMVKGKKF